MRGYDAYQMNIEYEILAHDAPASTEREVMAKPNESYEVTQLRQQEAVDVM
jgi:hypothetical protein